MKKLSIVVFILLLAGFSYSGEPDEQNATGSVSSQQERQGRVRQIKDEQRNIAKDHFSGEEKVILQRPTKSNQHQSKSQIRNLDIKQGDSDLEKSYVVSEEPKRLQPRNVVTGEKGLTSGDKGAFGTITATDIVMAIAAFVMMLVTIAIWRSNVLSNRVLMAESRPIISFEVDRAEIPLGVGPSYHIDLSV